jgi:hypothetical protein
MKIFLSWSGEISHRVAKAFYDWLPYVIQGVEAFLSSDISKGDRWNEALEDQLKETKYGILCVTPYNMDKAWMNFEAGALSQTISQAHVVPFLFRVDPKDLKGPLAQFQSTVYEKDDVFRMVHGLNKVAQCGLLNDRLERTFDKWWGDLDRELKAIPSSSQSETRTHYEWLYTQEDLDDIYNPDAPYRCLWVVASEAGKYLDELTIERIKAACAKGRHFQYFLPDSEADYRTDLQKIANAYPACFQFKIFKAEYFETQVASDYIISNPDGQGVVTVRVKLPLADAEHREYWFKTNDRSAKSFINRFRKLWETDGGAVAAGSH